MMTRRPSIILDEDSEKRAKALLESEKLNDHETLSLRVALDLKAGDSVAKIGQNYKKSRQNINKIKLKKLSTKKKIQNLLDTLEKEVESRPSVEITALTETDINQIAKNYRVNSAVVMAIASAEGKDGDALAKKHDIDPKVVYAIAAELGVRLGLGYTTIDQYRASLNIESEPIIELGGIYINSSMSIAVFALHETEEQRRDLIGLFKDPARIMDEEVHWTTVSCVDVCLNKLFSRLRCIRPTSQISDQQLRDSIPFVKMVREQFSKPYKLVIVHDIHSPEIQKSIDRMCNLALHVESDAFMSKIERIAHTFRHRRSCAGLFPSAQDLLFTLRSSDTPNSPSSAVANGEINWIGSSSNTEYLLRRSKAAQDYLCVRPGIICEMSSTLWKQLPIKNSVLLGEFKTKAKADWALPQSPDKYIVKVAPLPNVSFSIEVPSRSEDVLPNIRKSLIDTDIASRVFYTNELEFNPFIRKAFSFRYAEEISELLEVRVEGLRNAMDERQREQRKDHTKPCAGGGVVLFPRHFLIDSPISFDVLKKYQDQNRFEKPPIRKGFVSLGNSQVESLILHHPGTIWRIWKAFMEERYHRRLAEIDSGEKAAKIDVQYPKTVEVDYWYSDDPDNPRDNFDIEDIADAGLENFRDAFGRYPTEDDDQDFPSWVVPDHVRFRPSRYNKPPVHRKLEDLQPSESPFSRLLKDFDADFLISELDKDGRMFLMFLQEDLYHEIKEHVGNKLYATGHNINLALLRKYWPSIRQNLDDVEDWCSEAMESFARNQSRQILRLSLENAARYALAELKPEAVAIVPLETMFALFGKHFATVARRNVVRTISETKDQETSKPNRISRSEFAYRIRDIYLRSGYKSADFGSDCTRREIDLILTDSSDKTFVVCCNPTVDCNIGFISIRKLFNAMTEMKADGAIFVTAGKYNASARSFVRGKAIKLIDGKRLTRMIRSQKESEPVNG